MRQSSGPLKAYRIANRKYADLDGIGAALFPQRWNRKGEPLVYAAESLAVCQLEVLVHLDRATPPRDHVWIEIDVPAGVSVEEIDRNEVKGWRGSSLVASQRYGSRWIKSRRSAILIVPSKAAPTGRNILINPLHPDAARIAYIVHRPMQWDKRLFGPT